MQSKLEIWNALLEKTSPIFDRIDLNNLWTNFWFNMEFKIRNITCWCLSIGHCWFHPIFVCERVIYDLEECLLIAACPLWPDISEQSGYNGCVTAHLCHIYNFFRSTLRMSRSWWPPVLWHFWTLSIVDFFRCWTLLWHCKSVSTGKFRCMYFLLFLEDNIGKLK